MFHLKVLNRSSESVTFLLQSSFYNLIWNQLREEMHQKGAEDQGWSVGEAETGPLARLISTSPSTSHHGILQRGGPCKEGGTAFRWLQSRPPALPAVQQFFSHLRVLHTHGTDPSTLSFQKKVLVVQIIQHGQMGRQWQLMAGGCW